MNKRCDEERQYRRELGARLQRVRADRGLGQTEAAARIGIAVPTLYRYEAGTTTPGAWALDRIARGLDVSPGWLLSGPRRTRKPEPMVCSTGATMGPEMIDPKFRNSGMQGSGKTGLER